jgi:hypothetical protein
MGENGWNQGDSAGSRPRHWGALVKLEHSLANQSQSHLQEVWLVHSKHSNRDPANSGLSDEFRAVPLEVFSPLIVSGMVEADDIPRSRVDSGDVRPFTSVAV